MNFYIKDNLRMQFIHVD